MLMFCDEDRGMWRCGAWGVLTGLGLVLAGCGGARAAEPEPAINPQSVPSLALLDRTSERGEDVSGSGSGDSCETVSNAARERARESEMGEEAAEEHGDEIRQVLNRGTFLNVCGVPATSGVELCVAVVNGAAQGVTVWMTPGTQATADCVADKIRELSFPVHDLVSVARTNFEPG